MKAWPVWTFGAGIWTAMLGVTLYTHGEIEGVVISLGISGLVLSIAYYLLFLEEGGED